MRSIFITVACAATILAIVFLILPLGSLLMIPAIAALLFGYLAYRSSDESKKKFPKYILIATALICLAGITKLFVIKDKVVNDTNFENRIETSKEDAIKELDDIESELEEDLDF
ncbi:hypothetical protein HCG49_12230 [Arenibacter sp. 6A1]|uniref:hypothetical protein n=1 Tax=Arenibacter sp. 6A1 TaxID=2720391 RepID=UPI001444DD76|nr:hypothetical protein [Arenibacter sp. 6A1]NKI27332.1 hypothetical protein [Arenibacter sp. 6A1]